MRAAAILPRRPAPGRPLWVDRGPTVPPPEELLAACGGRTLVAAVLHARGFGAAEAAALLAAEPPAPADPFLFREMGTAVARLRHGAAMGERCVVFGDFDCDGLTGTAVLTEGLEALGLAVQPMLPNRRRDGYGLSPSHVDAVAGDGVRLLVTVDCGSTSQAALARAAACGVEVIVTDHHPLHGAPPRATALLNPRGVGERYPDRELCGAGMAHVLLRALERDGADIDPDAALDLVALGTIADVVPLRGENRGLVRRGLPRLAEARRPGIRALIEVAGVSRLTLGPRDVSFGLAPRLNAAGRLGDATLALALLRARRPRDARPLAAELDGINAQRQELTRRATEEAVERLEGAGGPGRAIVVWDGAWNPGVVGLVASRLVERYRRPAVVVGQADGRWRGSARSVEGFDVGAALVSCADLLLRQGGHPMAAGLEAAGEDRLRELRSRLESLALAALGPEERPLTIPIDLHLRAEEVDWDLAEALAALHPCGAGWPDTAVAIHGATVLDIARSGGALRLTVGGRGGMAVSAPARAEVLPPGGVEAGDVLDLAATPAVRDRRGYRCLELEVLDARHSASGAAVLPETRFMV